MFFKQNGTKRTKTDILKGKQKQRARRTRASKNNDLQFQPITTRDRGKPRLGSRLSTERYTVVKYQLQPLKQVRIFTHLSRRYSVSWPTLTGRKEQHTLKSHTRPLLLLQKCSPKRETYTNPPSNPKHYIRRLLAPISYHLPHSL